jgi:hypothetical protein
MFKGTAVGLTQEVFRDLSHLCLFGMRRPLNRLTVSQRRYAAPALSGLDVVSKLTFIRLSRTRTNSQVALGCGTSTLHQQPTRAFAAPLVPKSVEPRPSPPAAARSAAGSHLERLWAPAIARLIPSGSGRTIRTTFKSFSDLHNHRAEDSKLNSCSEQVVRHKRPASRALPDGSRTAKRRLSAAASSSGQAAQGQPRPRG